MPSNQANGVGPIPLWIDGKPQVPDHSNVFPVISSNSGKEVYQAVSAGVNEANVACDAASKAFRDWRKTTHAYRRGILYKVAEVYARRIDEIAAHQVAETSCQPSFAHWNIGMSLDYIREIAASSTEVRGTICQRSTSQEGIEVDGLTLVVTEPVGVVLIIPP